MLYVSPPAAPMWHKIGWCDTKCKNGREMNKKKKGFSISWNMAKNVNILNWLWHLFSPAVGRRKGEECFWCNLRIIWNKRKQIIRRWRREPEENERKPDGKEDTEWRAVKFKRSSRLCQRHQSVDSWQGWEEVTQGGEADNKVTVWTLEEERQRKNLNCYFYLNKNRIYWGHLAFRLYENVQKYIWSVLEIFSSVLKLLAFVRWWEKMNKNRDKWENVLFIRPGCAPV